MSFGFSSLIDSAKKLAINGRGSQPAPLETIFPKTDPAVDGDDCLHDCASCTVRYPRNFKIETDDRLYGFVKGWSTHLLVATGKNDWVRDVADEKGSIMQAVEKAAPPTNGNLMLSASNMPTPDHSSDYASPTRVLLLPAFVVVSNVTPAAVPALLSEFVSKAPTNMSRLEDEAATAEGTKSSPSSSSSSSSSPPPPPPSTSSPTSPPYPSPSPQSSSWRLPSLPAPLSAAPCPHSVLVLLCSQKTRDARCGQSAPLLRKELERHLRPLGLFRDLDDERPGGVGIYFISHVGGHKYSANVMVYRRHDAFGIDNVQRAALTPAERDALPDRVRAAVPAVLRTKVTKESNGTDGTYVAPGAAQCMWLARVRPEDCENLVKYTILQGKLVKPESQLRGGFDRSRGVLSW